MKIKILKDIPGYKAGQIVDRIPNSGNYLIYIPGYALNGSGEKHDVIKYPLDNLLDFGFIEFVEDAVDMEEIRKKFGLLLTMFHEAGNSYILSAEEAAWFNAFRIVKAVIEKLNGEWQPNWTDVTDKYRIFYNGKIFSLKSNDEFRNNILPVCKDSETAVKVIRLCKPELEVLFGVK